MTRRHLALIALALLLSSGAMLAQNPVSIAQVGTTPVGTTVPVSGTVTSNAGSGTFTISGTVTANAGTNLNTSALATAAKQPALGTAGTASADVITVQGIASMTPILATVTGTVTANAGTNLNTSALATSANQTNASQKTQIVDGSGNVISSTANAIDINVKSGGSTTVTEAATITANQASSALSASVLYGFDGTTDSRLRSRAGTIGSSDVGLVTRPFLPSDGTNTQPAMDAAARAGFQKLTDGTNTVVVDPCAGQTKVYTPISQTAGTQLVTGTSAKKTYVCQITLVVADAENISLVAGTGTVCATNTVAVIGGTSAAAGPNLAANGGFAIGNGASAVAATTVNADNLCLLQSGSGRIAGVLVSVVQ